MALPYYPRYPRDFLDGTASMTFELKGAYSILLDVIYAQDGRCPDNDRYVSGLLGCSVRAWRNYKNQLLDLGKIAIEDGMISNFRADKVLVKSRLFQEQQREKGFKPKKNKALEKPRLSQSESEPYLLDKGLSNRRRASRLSADWVPNQSDVNEAFGMGLTMQEIDNEAAKFRDYWIAKSGQSATKLDWSATWRNWCRSAKDRSRSPSYSNANANQQKSGSRVDAALRALQATKGGGFGW